MVVKPFGRIDIFIGFLVLAVVVLSTVVVTAAVAAFLYAGQAIRRIIKLFRK